MQGDERKNTMKFAEHQLPRAYHLKCLSNLSEEEIESGCRDSAPSKTVLKQIRYEARKVLTPFEDESKSLSEIHFKRTTKKRILRPRFSKKIAKNCLPLSLLWSSVMLGKCAMQVFTFSWV